MSKYAIFLFRNLLLAVFLTVYIQTAYSAEKPIIDTANIGNGVGEYRFELHKIGTGNYRRNNDISAEIRIYKKGTTTILQRLQVIIEIDDPGFQFMDVNGDGYNDLLLYDACVGFAGCSGPSIAADVFILNP